MPVVKPSINSFPNENFALLSFPWVHLKEGWKHSFYNDSCEMEWILNLKQISFST